MDGEEISKLVEELEERVERLRVLYDQYFMGIEKIPPDILKKDVERRMWVLRREKIRNTGVRFKFQMITQRLNTFQSYWMRICREIENGTFKRDLARARRRFGTNEAAQAILEQAPAEVHSIEVEEDEIVGDDLVGAVEIGQGGMRAFDDDLDEPLTRESKAPAPFKAPFMPPVKPAQLPPPVPPTTTSATNARPPLAAAPPTNAKPLQNTAKPASPPQQPIATKKADPETAARITSTITARRVQNEHDLEAMLDAALGGKEPTARTPAAAPVQAAPARPAAQPPTKPIAPATTTTATTATASSIASSSATNAGPRPPPGGRKPANVGKLGEPADPDRQVYARYVEAKRKNGESTANITFESLQKNLEATRAKLKEKSGGRAIDFDVVVKDGKTILKPTVK